jgi:hypothetical protein
MSQKSSLPQAAKSVSQVLMSDKGDHCHQKRADEHICLRR